MPDSRSEEGGYPPNFLNMWSRSVWSRFERQHSDVQFEDPSLPCYGNRCSHVEFLEVSD